MDNIQELERVWFKYKSKQVLKAISMFSLVGLLGGAAYVGYSKFDSISKHFFVSIPEVKVAEKNVTEHVESNKEISETKVAQVLGTQKENDTSYTHKHEVSLEPVIPIIDMEKEERKPLYRANSTASQSRMSQEPMVQAKPSTYLTAKELAVVNNALDSTTHKKIKLNSTSKNYIETMQEKFAKNKKPREALLLAKAFYSDKKYKEAEHWALIANKLDNNLDESWFVFAKSKAKLGQKKEAITILASYYKKSHSSKAKLLIEKIKKGNF